MLDSGGATCNGTVAPVTAMEATPRRASYCARRGAPAPWCGDRAGGDRGYVRGAWEFIPPVPGPGALARRRATSHIDARTGGEPVERTTDLGDGCVFVDTQCPTTNTVAAGSYLEAWTCDRPLTRLLEVQAAPAASVVLTRHLLGPDPTQLVGRSRMLSAGATRLGSRLRASNTPSLQAIPALSVGDSAWT